MFHLNMDPEESLLFEWDTRNLFIFSLCRAIFICTFSCVCSHSFIKAISQCQGDFAWHSITCFWGDKVSPWNWNLLTRWRGCSISLRHSSVSLVSCSGTIGLHSHTQLFFCVSDRYPSLGPYSCVAASLKT